VRFCTNTAKGHRTMPTLFNVTYEIITKESAEDGEAEEHGFICEAVSLRDAIGAVTSTESCHCEQSGVEANDSRVEHARWISVYNSMDWISGNYENRSLHIPESVTPASRRRIARLLGVKA